jgi:hypothetical protein
MNAAFQHQLSLVSMGKTFQVGSSLMQLFRYEEIVVMCYDELALNEDSSS